MKTLGIHHVTAITADPQANLDFYTGKLGLKLVKLTVNFDDPSSYHLYYGDATGTPGTIMTFFAWPGAPRARVPGQIRATHFEVGRGTLASWGEVLDDRVVLYDPDGLEIQLVEGDFAGREIRRIAGVTLAGTQPAALEFLGFQEKDGLYRSQDSRIEVTPRESVGQGAGTVHHVAFRAADDAELGHWRERVEKAGFHVSPVMDRKYFHSIYFREPGGVLFEIATDPPGFTVDNEPLGHTLVLPAWLEPQRDKLVRVLPPLTPATV